MAEKIDLKDEIRVRTTPKFKLKDKRDRFFQAINLEKQFGFIPEVIIIEKIHGANNMLTVKAVMTPDEIKKEDKILKEQEKANKLAEAAHKKEGVKHG